MKKTWRCTVCGYLHQGENPPESCPICHAGAEKFELVQPDGSAEEAKGISGLVREMIDSVIPHAVFSHFPNALIPTTVLFAGLFLLFGGEAFETTAFYLLIVSVLSVPPTLATGLYDWKNSFNGEAAPIFRKKIILASLLLICGLIAAVWRWQVPDLLAAGGWAAWSFLGLLALMLGCVTLLGHYGGRLVFAKNYK